MEVKLRVDAGKHAGHEIRIPGKSFVIGRGEECQLRAGSDMVSRRHCELVVADSYAAVRDLGSKNGTLVNGEQITGEVQLKTGDKLKVGPLEFVVFLVAGLTGKKHPPVHGVREAAVRSAAATSHTDDDIARWLTEGNPTPAAKNSSTTDTQQVRLSDTEEIQLGATSEAPTAAAAATEPGPQDNKRTIFGGGGPKKVFGKLPPVAPTAAPKDSREAAAEMIDKLRKRR